MAVDCNCENDREGEQGQGVFGCVFVVKGGQENPREGHEEAQGETSQDKRGLLKAAAILGMRPRLPPSAKAS